MNNFITYFIYLFVASLSAVIARWVFYRYRLMSIREPNQMRRFLDRRFDGIQSAGMREANLGIIDESIIRRWRRNFWGSIPFAAYIIMQGAKSGSSVGSFLGLGLVIMAGIFFGDARSCSHFLKVLGETQYRKSPTGNDED
jgi:hypothetical protein